MAKKTPSPNADQAKLVEFFLRTFETVVKEMKMRIRAQQEETVTLAETDGRQFAVNLTQIFTRVRQEHPEQWARGIEDALRVLRPDAQQELENVLKAGLQGNANKLLPCLKPTSFGRGERLAWTKRFVNRDPRQELAALIATPNLTEKENARRLKEIQDDPSTESDLLYLTLVIDLPESMSIVTKEMMQQAGGQPEKWLKIAKQNLIASTPPDWYKVEDTKSGLCRIAVNDSYDAPRALVLDELLPGKAPQGWFVITVAREETYFVPANDWTRMMTVGILKTFALKEFPKAAYALSDEVFWVHKGQWYPYYLIMSEPMPGAVPPHALWDVFGHPV